MGYEKEVKHNTSLFLLSSESARIVIATAYDRLGRELQGSTVIAQTMIVFISSVYDMLKTQIWHFKKLQ